MIFDPIADMLTIIRNGQASRKEFVTFEASKFKHAILDFLKERKYINSYIIEDKKFKVELKYNKDQPKIKEIEKITHSGARIYSNAKQLRTKTTKVGTYLVTTSAGLMDSRSAIKKGLGGELILRIW